MCSYFMFYSFEVFHFKQFCNFYTLPKNSDDDDDDDDDDGLSLVSNVFSLT